MFKGEGMSWEDVGEWVRVLKDKGEGWMMIMIFAREKIFFFFQTIFAATRQHLPNPYQMAPALLSTPTNIYPRG